MFQSKKAKGSEVEPTPDSSSVPAPTKEPKKFNWIKASIIANLVLVVGIVAAIGFGEVMHQSNTNPSFCGICHIMQSNVQSYLTSNHLDHVHEQAGVQCKQCHDYPLSAEITSGWDYVTGNYEVSDSGELVQRTFDNEMCTKCHGSLENVARQTDYLSYNPHNAKSMGDFKCNDCHKSHTETVDVCGQCHTHGGERLIENMNTPREHTIDESTSSK